MHVMAYSNRDFVSRYDKKLPHHFSNVSDVVPSNPVERSLSLQTKNTNTASTISYASSNHPNRSASLSQPTRSNGYMPGLMARNQMFSSATAINYGSGSHIGSYSKHWSPSSDSIPASTSRVSLKCIWYSYTVQYLCILCAHMCISESLCLTVSWVYCSYVICSLVSV